MRRACFGLILLSSVSACAREVRDTELPRVVVDHDDFVIDSSCEIEIPEGLVIQDQGLPGVIRITASDLELRFRPGSVLRGAPRGTPWNRLQGVGIRLEGASRVKLRGMRVEGFRAGLWATGGQGLLVEDAEFVDNFRQRLASTPLAEDSSDWLWPHDNEQNQWLERYGAALYLEDGAKATLRRIRVRRGQNGIVLDNMERCEVYDNDCSFLSGWGLAMWRASDNLICRNAFDFCVRGYSHGVYNRGQDSAGLLMFEQCCRNVIAENSATHGGDGLFGFAGKEALGEGGEFPEDWYRRRGNNDNLLLGNDFSFAPAHGIEMTFSFGNRFVGNRLEGNAICGVWGGFSQDTLIADNDFIRNGEFGYGLERGGVNIDRSRGNLVIGNRFRENRCGVHVWSLPTDFVKRPWGRANDLTAAGTVVCRNEFDGDELALHLRGACSVEWGDNQLRDVAEEQRLEAEATVLPASTVRLMDETPNPDLLGKSRPVGARAHLAGRENIVVGPWGPWDHEEPILLVLAEGPGFRSYEVHPRGLKPEVELLAGSSAGLHFMADSAPGASGAAVLRFEAREPGLHHLQATVRTEQSSWMIDDWLWKAEWDVQFFPWTVDPREDEAGWRQQAASAVQTRLDGLELHFDHGGPERFLPEESRSGAPGADHFGTLASCSVPLPAGRYRLRTLSDDGIRVLVDGEAVVDDWTWHAPKEILGEFEVEQDRSVRIEVAHFEIDGFSKLVVELERAD